MYQVLHDTNNVTDSGCHCVSADQSSRAVINYQWQSVCVCAKFDQLLQLQVRELFTVVRPCDFFKCFLTHYCFRLTVYF